MVVTQMSIPFALISAYGNKNMNINILIDEGAGSKPHGGIGSVRCFYQYAAVYIPFQYAIVSFYAACAVLSTIFLWKSQDGYFIKTELKIVVVSIIFGVITGLLVKYPMRGGEFGDLILQNFWLIISHLGGFGASGIYLWYLTKQTPRRTIDSSQDIEELIKEDKQFRNELLDFLVLQLSVDADDIPINV
eukprot:TRINITY_DN227_c0_g2_i2.p1 TRINITY_DN227_c0_g2~~TRINITY_DN227_c0_g2_i2.p1  ORF type:complete len:190 (+),score=26.09 TRINITY_DN227_c0_g2_i2:733-1302(+)